MATADVDVSLVARGWVCGKGGGSNMVKVPVMTCLTVFKAIKKIVINEVFLLSYLPVWPTKSIDIALLTWLKSREVVVEVCTTSSSSN